MADRVVTVFGGSGFLGRDIVRRLAAASAQVRIAVRRPQRARAPEGNATVVAMYADVRDRASLGPALKGATAAVNAVSAYVEKGDVSFAAVHERGAANVAHEAAKAGLERLVHISGIGTDAGSPSKYIRARGRGEALVKEAFPTATILRPSVMFGPEDAFFNTLASLTGMLPALPLFGGGKTKLQPVYVEDAAVAVERVLAEPATAGRTYELGGPRVYTLKELMETILRETGRRRALVPLPFFVAEIQATLAELLPRPPLTTAQVDLLKQDNVVAATAQGFGELDVSPRSVEDILPTYIGRGRAR